MGCSLCYHCGETILSGRAQIAQVNGAQHPVCCSGCQAAVEWIGSMGLHDYYRLREQPAERATTSGDYSAWDRPALQRLYVRQLTDGNAEIGLLLDGLRCAACSWLVERALSSLAGMQDVRVNVLAKQVCLTWNPQLILLSKLLGTLGRLGYTPHPLNAESLHQLIEREQHLALKRLAVAGLGMMQAMMFAITLYAGAFEGIESNARDFFRWLGFLVTTPVVLYSAQPFFYGLWQEWRAKRLGMDTPVALAVGLVYIASLYQAVRGGDDVYFDSASMFVFFLLSGRYLEMRARHRAADSAHALARLQPALANRRNSNGELETVGVHELNPGDLLSINAGSTVPADGVLVSVHCRVDESLLSGESTPHLRHRGDPLLAGSLLVTGPVDLQVTRIGADTTLSSIMRLITQAQQLRPRWIQFGEQLAARFVAGVLLLTLITAAAWLWIDPTRAFPAALAVLVVSCPCAFALAVPATLTRALSVLARKGILVLKPDALRYLAQARRFIFDKTGTLTENRLELVSVTALREVTPDACLGLAARLEEGNTHPIAQALRRAADIAAMPMASDRQLHNGAGIEGTINGERYRIGQRAFIQELTGNIADVANDETIILADRHGALACFVLRESLRSDAIDTVTALHAANIDVKILSGDSSARVAAIATRLGISDWQARLSPTNKLQHMQTLRSNNMPVVMVGDGLNDAPVLAGADVAIALGSGAELSQANADIVVASNRLDAILEARAIAKITFTILQQNLYWSLVYNFLCIPLAALGCIPAWLAALGMSFSSLLVVLNSLRIRASNNPIQQETKLVSSTIQPAQAQ